MLGIKMIGTLIGWMWSSTERPRSGCAGRPGDRACLGQGTAGRARWGGGAALPGWRGDQTSLSGTFPNRAGLEEAVSWGHPRPSSHADLRNGLGFTKTSSTIPVVGGA